MSVNGAYFLLFLLISAVFYYAAPKKIRWFVLLCASVTFYLLNGIKAGLYLLATALFTYLASLLLGKKPSVADGEDPASVKKRDKRRKRAILAPALIINFSVLGVLKYGGFFVTTVNTLIGRTAIPLPSFILPLGISFYIFQTSAYLIDTAKGKNPLKYLLFVCWFPQMVQGPINRFDLLSGQLYAGSPLDWENIRTGLLRMIFGILKKAAVADALAPFVADVYSNYQSRSGGVILLGAALYCLQLYCDFSGGIDLLCGASQLFGIKMSENFRQPYFSTSLADFWRRWHISLGEWMKDYLFYPIALSKRFAKITKFAKKHMSPGSAKRVTPCIATFIVFLAVGIWQGPGWQNIAYGIWNGTLMSLGLIWAPVGARIRKRLNGRTAAVPLLIWGIIRTNVIVVIGRYFSNSSSLTQAFTMLGRTFSFAPSGDPKYTLAAYFDTFMTVRLAVACGLLIFISALKEKGIDPIESFCRKKWYVQFAVLSVCLVIIVIGIYANSNYVPISYVYENV